MGEFCGFRLYQFSQHSWLYFTPGITPPPTDILFLIDGSGSMKKHNFDQLRVLLKNMIDKMSIGPYGSHVALIQFSSRQLTKVEFNLDTYSNRDSYSNKQDIKKAIDDMVYQKKYTYTGYAMEMANKEVRLILKRLLTSSAIKQETIGSVVSQTNTAKNEQPVQC